MTIRLLIADEQEFTRAGLRSFLQDTEIQIMGEAATAAEALAILRRQAPDVMLLSPKLSEGERLEILHQIRDLHELPVLIVSTHASPALLAAAVAGNAAGILLKDCDRDSFVSAIRSAASGRTLWSREELRRAGSASDEADPELGLQLTRREGEVLEQLVKGLTNKQIAQELQISYETVKEHVQHILHKIGVTDRTQAAVWAVRNGLV